MTQRESFEEQAAATRRGMPSHRGEALRRSAQLHNWDKQPCFYTKGFA